MSEKNLKDPVTKISQVGQAKAKSLKRIGIESVGDLLSYLPRKVLDLSNPVKLDKVNIGDKVIIRAKPSQITHDRSFRKRLSITRALLSDDSGSIEAVWFNQPYLKNSLKKDRYAIFVGEVRIDKYSGRASLSSPEVFTKAGLYPVYHLTEGISSKQISRYIKNAMAQGYNLDEFLSLDSLKKHKLINMSDVVKSLHFPKIVSEYWRARQRLIFNELLVLMAANMKVREKIEKSPSYEIKTDESKLSDVAESLPFTLTPDQSNALSDIVLDLSSGRPMNRVVQGDVGSGKTIVALLSSWLVSQAGLKTVWLAPTQVLARQHYETAKKMMPSLKVNLVISGEKNQNFQKSDLIIGTHAILYRKSINDLGLIVVDEQHRFGVHQRERVRSSKQKQLPHFLSMTATPIPRTLGHVIFGNLDVSTIKTKPKGRVDVKTYLVPENKREDSYSFVNQLISKGQKAFVICPAIEDSSDLKAVESEYEALKNTPIGDNKIILLHGNLRSIEKEKAFKEFADGDGQILVSTSVVEVGVDVPEATVMIIEDAHRFGLSQLHQFRGRVGRSDIQSYCFCFSNNLDNDKAKERLKAFVQNSDGFKLAEFDFKQRGPGALVGLEQSGFTDVSPHWFEDMKTVSLAKEVSKEISLDDECIKDKVEQKIQTSHLE